MEACKLGAPACLKRIQHFYDRARSAQCGALLVKRPFSKPALALILYCCNNRIMRYKKSERVVTFADMFSAIGTEARLRRYATPVSAHPMDLSSAKFKKSWDIPNSTLSHHLDKLKNEGYGEKVHSWGTPPIRMPFSNCCSLFTPNAAHVPRPSNPNRSLNVAGKGGFDEQCRH
jgi:hypothetical protein